MRKRRTITREPEPRYVERARHVDNAVAKEIDHTIVTRIDQVDEGILVTYSNDSQILVPIMGSEELVVDINEAGDKITIHLDYGQKNILSRALVTPVQLPLETEVVAIGVNGAQVQLTLQELANLLKPYLT